ncbi:MAG: phosphoadenylyl-sulfate reductase [Candidatus Sumerlaeaceae bacterium]|nr:phosphoadenylyl-sulfate reductase [Candidatus Sumerlaeaceae bacterium]
MITPDELVALNEQLELMAPQQILGWAIERFGTDQVALQVSMQKTSCALMHMLSEIDRNVEVIFVDTGAHFPETLSLRDEYARRLNLKIVTYSPQQTFEEQFQQYQRHLYLFDDEFDPPGYRECCRLRKEEPFLAAVRGRFKCVIGGLMRAEGGARSSIRVLNFDPRFNGYKLYPLANWRVDDVDSYLDAHALPVHPLYARGYRSIGCTYCTTPVKEGEPSRAGRWRHIREAHPERYGQAGLYCGINLEDRVKQSGDSD